MTLREHERFREPMKRRDFLGLSATWMFFASFVAAALGALKLPIPAVFPESSSRLNVGHPEDYAVGSAVKFSIKQVWLLRDERGFYAISSICTHLGCITRREADGRFICPCHGSKYDPTGKVVGGPAPRNLPCPEISLAPNGRLIIDTQRNVPADHRFVV